MKKMKNTASVGTIGHFDMAGSEGQEDMKIDDITLSAFSSFVCGASGRHDVRKAIRFSGVASGLIEVGFPFEQSFACKSEKPCPVRLPASCQTEK